MTRLLAFLLLAASTVCLAVSDETVRIKDLGRVEGWRTNQLTGFGIVTGLAGTGDSSRSKATRQSIANVLGRFNLSVSSDQIESRNVAIVVVTATLPPFARRGDRLDVTVTSIGDARSLLGGSLVLTPLRGPDGRDYALAQGPISIGGYKYDLNSNVLQKNHPTVGTIPGGANIEAAIAPSAPSERDAVTFVLSEPDYTTADRIAKSIDQAFGGARARSIDAASIEISIPETDRANLVAFLTKVENVQVAPDRRAKVIVNERTGTVVSGGDVRIAKVTVTHGDIKVSIITDYLVSQPAFVRQTDSRVRTEVVPHTRINVDESEPVSVSLPANNTVADLVRALNKVRVSTRDLIAILQGIKAAGALHADLIIQ